MLDIKNLHAGIDGKEILRGVNLHVNPGDVLALRQEIGHIETSKAQSDLFAPIAGTMSNFNDEVLKDPAVIEAYLGSGSHA